MKVVTSFVLAAVVGAINSVSGNQQMMMGGTVKDFLDELLRWKEITQPQYNFLLREADTVIFEGHHARDNVFRPVSGTTISSYIDGEVTDGRITRDTADYLSNLLNLRNIEEITSESPRFPSANTLAVKSAPAYTGNGNVVRLGKIKPETINSNELYNGIWGYAVGKREYALQCNSRGLHIIDVTNTNNIFQVQKIAMSGGTIWRDVEVYDNYAYVAAQSGGNFFVVNLSKLSGDPGSGNGPNSNPIQPSDYADRGRKDWGHTLSIGNGLLFLNTAGGQKGCQIFDLKQNPFNPPLISSWSGSGNDCHDSFARANVNNRDLLFSADGYSGKFRLLNIKDIRKGINPQKIGETPRIGSVYAHSIYPSEDNNFLYAFDEENNFDIIVWDISDPSKPSLVSTIQWSGENTEGDAIIHNGQVRGNYLLTAYYEAGFRVFDISNPANAVEVGKYETYRDPDGKGVYERTISTEYEGAWNLYSFLPSGNVLVSDQSSGTFIFRVDEVDVPTAPTGLTVTLLDGDVRARLEWHSSSASEGKPTGYTVKRSVTRGGPYTSIKTNIIGTEYTDDGLTASSNVVYYYVVTATNARGESSLSNEVSMTPSTPEPTRSLTPAPTPSSNGPDLILSEILPNPKQVSDKHGEFIEIFNPDSTNVLLDKTRYRLCKSSNNRCRKMTGEVSANGYYVFCRNSNKFPGDNICDKSRLFGLNNKGDTIRLQKNVDGSWITVDEVEYPGARNKGDQGFARNENKEPFCKCWDWSRAGYSAGYGP